MNILQFQFQNQCLTKLGTTLKIKKNITKTNPFKRNMMNLWINTNSTKNSFLAKANCIINILSPPAKAGGNSKDGDVLKSIGLGFSPINK